MQSSDTNVNLSDTDRYYLQLQRTQARLARKAANKRRYLRQYARRGPQPYPSHLPPGTVIDLYIYGPIGRDTLT